MTPNTLEEKDLLECGEQLVFLSSVAICETKIHDGVRSIAVVRVDFLCWLLGRAFFFVSKMFPCRISQQQCY